MKYKLLKYLRVTNNEFYKAYRVYEGTLFYKGTRNVYQIYNTISVIIICFDKQKQCITGVYVNVWKHENNDVNIIKMVILFNITLETN